MNLLSEILARPVLRNEHVSDKQIVPAKQHGIWREKCKSSGARNTEERMFVIDSGASMHMLSKDLSSDERNSLRRSRTPTKVVTANGEVHTNEEAQVYVQDLDLFVTVDYTIKRQQFYRGKPWFSMQWRRDEQGGSNARHSRLVTALLRKSRGPWDACARTFLWKRSHIRKVMLLKVETQKTEAQNLYLLPKRPKLRHMLENQKYEDSLQKTQWGIYSTSRKVWWLDNSGSQSP